jgi:hypothetical protein
MLRHVVSKKLTDITRVLAASIIGARLNGATFQKTVIFDLLEQKSRKKA